MLVVDDRRLRVRMARVLEDGGLRLRDDGPPELAEGVGSVELLVIHTPRLGARDVTVFRALKQTYNGLPVIAVCDSADVRTTRRAVDAGVNGVLLTDQIEAALWPTVAAVLVGQTVVPAALGASLRRQSLSFREKQILGLVVLGFTNSQIGARLFLAESTVKSHLSSAFTKLDVASRSEAAALILDPQEPFGVGIVRLAEQFAEAGNSVSS